jgi:uncharacterized protein YjbI with pentapeptide repeats
MLRHSMPMEQLQIATFKDALFQSRNAEESLLIALNGCSRLTGRVSVIDPPNPAAFGARFKRIQGQRTEVDLAAHCLSFLDLREANLLRGDFFGANFEGANLERANLGEANLEVAHLCRANLFRANLYRANLYRANLEGATLDGANLDETNLFKANLDGASLDGASFNGANLVGAKLPHGVG